MPTSLYRKLVGVKPYVEKTPLSTAVTAISSTYHRCIGGRLAGAHNDGCRAAAYILRLAVHHGLSKYVSLSVS